MIVEKRHWTPQTGWLTLREFPKPASPQLVLAFGAPAALADGTLHAQVRAQYPQAHLAGCSTAGEIVGTNVCDDSLVTVAIAFAGTRVRLAHRRLAESAESAAVGEALAIDLRADDLAHVLVLSDGIHVNGSALAKGMQAQLPPSVLVTGGLAGDAGRFARTLLWMDDQVMDDAVIAIGLYGTQLRVGHGSLGGWDPFGPDRLITRSEGNVLYELDGAPALQLYKDYLGVHAASLPGSGLLFPLNLRASPDARPVVRTILGIDETRGSLIFAGDVPQGYHAQLMKANFDRLVDGAQGAAVAARDSLGKSTPPLALLISCVGRKLVLKQRVEEEVESVRDVLGTQASLVGFYSYGEIAPVSGSRRCELHNQTMTITTLDEAVEP